MARQSRTSPKRSLPFRFDDFYCRYGTYWRLKDKSNPLGLHQVIRPLAARGVAAELHAVRGWHCLKDGDSAAAERNFTEARRRDPRSAVVIVNLANLRARDGKFDVAIADCNRAIELNPGYAMAYCERGDCFRGLGKFDLAIADCKQALLLNPMLSYAYAARCRVYGKLGQFNLALTDADAALKWQQDSADLYKVRAEAWERRAQRNYEILSSIRQRQTSPPAKVAKSNYPQQQSSASENMAVSNAKLAEFWKPVDFSTPASGGTQVSHGDDSTTNLETQYERAIQDEYNHAAADLGEAIRLDPKCAATFAFRAVIYANLGKTDKALADLDEAIRLDSKNIAQYKFRGQINEYIGDLDKAMADFDAVIRLDPKSAEAYTARADLYARKHETAKAAADYAEAERLSPSDDRYR
jgi:tetratricopeptide (TPR) repeat protein